MNKDQIIEINDEIYEKAVRDALNPDKPDNPNSYERHLIGLHAVIVYVRKNDFVKEEMKDALDSCNYYCANHSSNDRWSHDERKVANAIKLFNTEKEELEKELI